MHLVVMHNAIEEFEPRAVILDPISSLGTTGTQREVKLMLVRLFDYLKNKQITCLVTSLMAAQGGEETQLGMSSLIDTWIQMRDIELAGERTRGLFLIKSRGVGHSNQLREFVIRSHGIDLIPVEVGPNGVLTGSAREDRENERRTEAMARAHEREHKLRQLERRRILAVPTLIKKLPEPLQRFIGDLSDKRVTIVGMDLRRR
jgi:circadian clock protein KaiC